jgi:hypothetical protein
MKFSRAAVMASATLSLGMLCYGDPLQRTVVPPPDQGAYPVQKPLPQEAPPPAPTGPTVEQAFVQAYVNHRSPTIMIFVNRTIHGDPLPKDGLVELTRTEEHHTATGAVNVNSQNSSNTSSQTAGQGTASVQNKNTQSGGSFASGGPTEYTKTTSVKQAAPKNDEIGAAPEDYELIEASLVKYFDDSGRVHVQDADAARGKLDRAQILRVENGDPQAARLLSTELKQDVLIRVTAKPTRHSQYGPAVRLIAKAVSTADARNLGTAFVDMPLPMTKTNINVFTRYLSESLMDEMIKKWGQSPEFDPVEIRIYKTASVDDALRIKKWLQATRGVVSVTTRAATGGSNTSYASFSVAYSGAPEDLYADLKDAIGASQGLKAVDVQNNTIDLEVTGKLDLVTTTRKSETITTTTTVNTEEKRIEPINPAPAPSPTPVVPDSTPAPTPGPGM